MPRHYATAFLLCAISVAAVASRPRLLQGDTTKTRTGLLPNDYLVVAEVVATRELHKQNGLFLGWGGTRRCE